MAGLLLILEGNVKKRLTFPATEMLKALIILISATALLTGCEYSTIKGTPAHKAMKDMKEQYQQVNLLVEQRRN